MSASPTPSGGIHTALPPVVAAVLELVCLQRGDRAVEVDGFVVQPNGAVPLCPPGGRSGPWADYENVRSYAYHEPRIRLIAQILSHLLACGRFLKNGRPVTVDGFCLRPLEQWLGRSLPRLSIMGNLGSLSPVCNMRCEFCYEVGNVLAFDRRMISLEEAKTRIRRFDVKRRRGLVRSLRSGYEDLCNPHALEILEAVRARSPELIRLTTNGSKLTPPVIERLGGLKPVLVCLSLNSVDPKVRRELMKDRNPQVAIQAIPRLREAGIPFMGSVVPWRPFDLGHVERTIRYLDEHEALNVRVCLPGYSRFFSDRPLFDREDVWGRVIDLVRRLRREVRCPVIPTPALYGNQAVEAEIDGVFFRSPAWEAGIRSGDVLLSVNDTEVYTRCDARRALDDAEQEPRLELVLRRGPQTLRTVLEAAGDADGAAAASGARSGCSGYPFWPADYPGPLAHHTGIQFVGDFDKNDLVQIPALAGRYDARRVLLVTTPLMRQNLLRVLKMLRVTGNTMLDHLELRIAVAKQSFWGGNILVGDLNVVSDFIETVDEIRRLTGYQPELVLIPSSFANEWGLDLRGESFRRIEAALGVPVERVITRRIYE
ncbi:MAG: radical SAM protein [Planctomycetota bacterium]